MLDVGRNFRPDVGFLRRSDFRRSYGELRFSPRPTRLRRVRKFTWVTAGDYVENGAGQVDSRLLRASFATEFQSSDLVSIDVVRNHDVLQTAFAPAGSPAPIPVGAYTFTDAGATITFGAQRRVSGLLSARAGDYYDGTIRSVTIGGTTMAPARVSFNKHLSVEPAFTVSRVERAAGAFTTRLARTRIDYGFTPLMFASALVQYTSGDRALSSNVRFRWEYAPGSELFLVYSDERSTDDPLAPPTAVRGIRNRAIVFKVNRLLRY